MKTTTFVSVFLLALATVKDLPGGNTASTTPAPLPAVTTSCGKKAVNCYKGANGEYLATLNIQAACVAFKGQLDCFENLVSDDDCDNGNNEELKTIKARAEKDVEGVCLPDGTVGSCGVDLQKCSDEAQVVKNDFVVHNAGLACPALTKFKSCTEEILTTQECPDKLNALVATALEGFSKEELVEGCDGPCGQEAGKCVENVDFIGTQPLAQIDWNSYCKTMFDAIQCLDGLSGDQACVGDGTDTNKATILTSSLQSYIEDFCDIYGKPSICNQQIQNCAADVTGLDSNSDIAAQCQATANFLECTSDLACHRTVKTFMDQQKIVLETDEQKANCPTVGSCSDRIQICSMKESEIGNPKPEQTTSDVCKLIKTGMACYDIVRKDPQCILEAPAVSDYEKKLRTTLRPKCGDLGDGAAYIHTSLVLLVTSLLVSLVRQFL